MHESSRFESLFDQPRGFGSARCALRFQNEADIVLHRAEGQMERIGDLGIAPFQEQQMYDLPLPRYNQRFEKVLDSQSIRVPQWCPPGIQPSICWSTSILPPYFSSGQSFVNPSAVSAESDSIIDIPNTLPS